MDPEKRKQNDVRSFQAVELRSITADDGKLRKIAGRPAVFNVLSEDLGGFRERILPGAFTKTLQEGNCKSLWNHDSNMVLGSVRAGTLTVREDSQGLTFEVTPPDTTWARDSMVSIDRGDVDQMSFMFQCVRDNWLMDYETDEVIRELVECRLYEVSPVTFPAYPQTSCNLRDKFGTDINEEIRAKIEALKNPAAPAECHPAEEPKDQVQPDYSYQERKLKTYNLEVQHEPC
jgi:uncharacterized protein